MGDAAAYVIRLSALSMMVGLLLPMVSEGTPKLLLRLVGSILLTVTALSPLTDLRFPELSEWDVSCALQGEAAAAAGEALAQESRNTIIQQRTAAYILDKAAALGAQITPEVELDSHGLPRSVMIRGDLTGQQRQRLSGIMEEDLGIPKEKQTWTGYS